MELRHQVFVSSTFSDLREERQAAVEAILQAGHIPAGMELFAAEDRSQLEVIKSWIDESDIYLLVLGSRYGSIEPDSKFSYTEFEYRYALDSGKPVFALVLSDKAIDEKHRVLGASASDSPDRLRTFRQFVMSKIVRIVDNRDQIKLFTLESLQSITRRYTDLPGWVRMDKSSKQIALELANLTKLTTELRDENLKLRERLAQRPAASSNVDRWIETLSNHPLKNDVGEETTLIKVLMRYQELFAQGVTSSYLTSSNAKGKWLYTTAALLASMGLAQKGKTPDGARWTVLQLSKEGIAIVGEMTHRLAAQRVLKGETTLPDSPNVPKKPRLKSKKGEGEGGA